MVAQQLVTELAITRKMAGLSQAGVAAALGTSQSDISRMERLVRLDEVSMVRVAELASLLGLDLSAGLHPLGDPIRDRGHQALGGRFRRQLSPRWRVTAEAAFPNVGDRRSWDLLLRLDAQLVGVEIETRIRDVQRLVRHIRERERDGGVDEIVLVLSDSQVNRRLLPELIEALGPRFHTFPRRMLAALRAGRPLSGSGVVLL